MRAEDEASAWAIVPPPAPLPMMMMSKRSVRIRKEIYPATAPCYRPTASASPRSVVA
jgi:hypothetical protein